MTLILGLLTIILVLNCLILILLVLIQLPKKEAGMGTAFGGGATDALFGAGSGTALSKITKYAAGIFFLLVLTLSTLRSRFANEKDLVGEELGKTTAVATPTNRPPAQPTNMNRLLLTPGLTNSPGPVITPSPTPNTN